MGSKLKGRVLGNVFIKVTVENCGVCIEKRVLKGKGMKAEDPGTFLKEEEGSEYKTVVETL